MRGIIEHQIAMIVFGIHHLRISAYLEHLLCTQKERHKEEQTNKKLRPQVRPGAGKKVGFFHLLKGTNQDIFSIKRLLRHRGEQFGLSRCREGWNWPIVCRALLPIGHN